jgi:hypothetical protein
MCQAIEEMMNDSFNDGCDNKGNQVFLNCKNRGMSTEQVQAIAEISDKLVEIAL